MPTIAYQSNYVADRLGRNADLAEPRDDLCYARNPDLSYSTNDWWGGTTARVGGGENSDTAEQGAQGPSGEWGLLNPAPEERERLAREVWRKDKPRHDQRFYDLGTNEPVHWPFPLEAYVGPAYQCVDRHYAKPDKALMLAVEVDQLSYDAGGNHTIDIRSVKPATPEQVQKFMSSGLPAEEDPLLYAACHSKAGCHDQASVEASLRGHFDVARSVQDTPGERREEAWGSPPVLPYGPRLSAAMNRESMTLYTYSRQPSTYGVPKWAQRDQVSQAAGGSDRQCLPTPVTGNGVIAAGPLQGQVLDQDSKFYCPMSRSYSDDLL